MDEQSFYQDFLYAYTLGCLDKEDYMSWNSYINSSNAQLNWQTLGEYQNLIALLPSILNIEAPDPKLKDAVALKLYKINSAKRSIKAMPAAKSETINRNENDEEKKIMQEQTLLNISNEKTKPTEKVDENLFQNEVNNISSAQNNNQILERKNDFLKLKKSISTNGENTDKTQKHIGTSEQSRLIRERILNQAAKEENKHKNLLIYFSLFLFIAVAAALAVLYYNASTQINNYKNHIANLNKIVTDFSSKLDKEQNLVSILQSKDINIINMTASKLNPDGSGRIIISFAEKKGFLQLLKLPTLPDTEAYQLWARVKGSYISLGLFNPTKKTNIYPFSVPELSNSSISFFILTKSPALGANQPNSEVYLIGVQK